MTPFANRPIQTQGTMRIYHPTSGMQPDGFGLPHTGSFSVAPGGKGGQAIEYTKQAGHCIKLAFPVDQSNRLPDYFKFMQSLDGEHAPLEAIITTDGEGQHIVAHYGQHPNERETASGYPWGWYVAPGNPHNAVTHELPLGTCWLWVDAKDGVAAKIVLWHQGSN